MGVAEGGSKGAGARIEGHCLLFVSSQNLILNKAKIIGEFIATSNMTLVLKGYLVSEWRIIYSGKARMQGNHFRGFLIIQAGDDRGLDERGNERDSEKWSESGYIMEADLKFLLLNLMCGMRERKKSMMMRKVFSLSMKNAGAVYLDVEHMLRVKCFY